VHLAEEFLEARFLDLAQFVGVVAEQQGQFVDCGRGGCGECGVGTEGGEQREHASLELDRYVCGHLGGGDHFHAGVRCGRVGDRVVEQVC